MPRLDKNKTKLYHRKIKVGFVENWNKIYFLQKILLLFCLKVFLSYDGGGGGGIVRGGAYQRLVAP